MNMWSRAAEQAQLQLPQAVTRLHGHRMEGRSQSGTVCLECNINPCLNATSAPAQLLSHGEAGSG